jgi:glycerol-3-phosphate acyltransferase PlsY
MDAWPIWIGFAYLLGSIPFGLLLGKMHGIDIRVHGSGNIGATNLGRALGRRWGLLCFVLDLGKGAVPTLGAGWANGLLGRWMVDIPAETSWLWLAVGLAALLGHVFPVYLRFKGGKGVATAFGILLGVFPTLSVAALGGLATWLLVIALTRVVSLASMIAACMVPLTTAVVLWWIAPADTVNLAARFTPPMVITLLVAMLVLLRHRSNIARLLRGTETTLGPDDAQD